MEFLGIGYQELLLVLALLLVVVGPERLPAMAYQIGRAVRQMQRYARAVRDEFSDEFDYIEEQYRTVKGEIDTTRTGLREQQTRFESEMRQATEPLNEPLVPAESTETGSASQPTASNSSKATAEDGGSPSPTAEPATKPEEERERPPLLF